MKEIEMKIQISEEQHQMLELWLEKNAEYSGESHHIEYYLDNPEKPFKFRHKLGYIDSGNYLRVRITEKGDSVCLKIFEIDLETGASRNIAEYETKVADGLSSLQLFRSLGYIDETVVDKTRKSYKYNDFEIEIDEVKNLGIFVEIEVKNHGDDDKTGFRRIKDLLREIGITTFAEQKRGYVSMLWNPNYNFAQQKTI